jgi:carboxymethylenebutenolidase
MALETENVTIRLGMDSYQGYFACPAEGKHPGVIVLQEIFGVNEHIRSVTEKLASEGFACLAPDLFWRQQPGFTSGYSPEEIEAARKIRAQVDQNTLIADLKAAFQTLRNRPECSGRTGVIGFCFGGLVSYLAAAKLNPTCAVAYYGGGIAANLDAFYSIRSPILFHFGARDAHITQDQVDKIRETAKLSKTDWELHVYPEAGHGFNCDHRKDFHPPSAREAWLRTLAFLQRHLMAEPPKTGWEQEESASEGADKPA